MDAFFAYIAHLLTYLPPVFQVPILLWTMIVCVATTAFLKKLPAGTVSPWQLQFFVFTPAAWTTIPLMPASLVYSIGTAWVLSSVATSFYDLAVDAALNYVTKKLQSFGFISQPPVTTATPRPATPDSIIKS